MTKNVSFSSLSFMFESINLDYFLLVLKMSETNHKKILIKDQKFYQPFIGIKRILSIQLKIQNIIFNKNLKNKINSLYLLQYNRFIRQFILIMQIRFDIVLIQYLSNFIHTFSYSSQILFLGQGHNNILTNFIPCLSLRCIF